MNSGITFRRAALMGGLFLALWGATGPSAHAAIVVTRGPYLQQGTPTSMLVCWRTSLPTAGFVRFGPEATNLMYAATNLAVTSNHVVAVTNLQPGTRYYYEV